MKRSVQRKQGVKLWRPGLSGEEHVDNTPTTVQDPAADDLDALLDLYTQQAHDETSALEEQLRRQQQPKGKAARVQKQQEALATPLSEDNKGFQLLTRMGYKAGVGLGRREQGMVQPIAVQMRTARAGLGVDEQKREREQKAAELELQRAAKRARDLDQQRVDYRDVVKASFQLKSLQKQLRQAVRVTEDLDQQVGISSNEMLERIARQLEEDEKEEEGDAEDGDIVIKEEKDELSVEDMLESLLQYLRTEHCYCLYCGCKYDGADDLKENCPGVHEDDH